MTDPGAQARELARGMRRAISAFESGSLPFARLMWELKSRIAAMGDYANADWVDELKSKWNELEFVNATFIDSHRDALTEDERSAVVGILSELKAMLVEY